MGDGWSAPRPGSFTPGVWTGTRCIGRGWAPGPVRTGTVNIARTEIRSPERPARSQSLYRIRYAGLHNKEYTIYWLTDWHAGIFFFHPHGATAPSGSGSPCYRGFTITLRHTTLGWVPPEKSDQPNAETYTWQHTTLRRGKHPCLRRGSNPQCKQASGRRPTP